MANTAAVLYSSKDVRNAIAEIFSERTVRRVAISAYVGDGAQNFLPCREGLYLVCSPSPGTTNPHTIRELLKDGVEVDFVDRLHMKLYWAEGRGCILTSANLSTNALGLGSLKKVGVRLGPDVVDIDRLLQSLQRRPARYELRKLDVAHRVFAANNRQFRSSHRAPTFMEWYNSPERTEWKVLWFLGSYDPLSKTTLEEVHSHFPGKVPYNWCWSQKRTVREGEWILCTPTSEAIGQGCRMALRASLV
jgi:hypothetical protein